MKRNFTLLTVLVLFGALSACAQETSGSTRKKIDIGMVTGVNVSYFSDRIGEFGDLRKYEYDPYVRISTTAGIQSRLHLSRIFSVRAEVLYNARGGSYRSKQTAVINLGGDEPTYFYKNYRLNYVEFPILVEADFRPYAATSEPHFSFAGGLSYGVLLTSSLRYNGFPPTGGSVGPFEKVRESYNVVAFNYAKGSLMNYVLEASCDFQNGKSVPLFLRLRYAASFGPVYRIDSLDGNNMETKMSTVSLTFGVWFLRV